MQDNFNLFSGKNLPKTLTKEEFCFYLEKMHQGDMQAREKLIIHNIRLVMYRINKRFFGTPYSKNELISIGFIGLIKSVDTYDMTKKVNFATYAARCIDNEILMLIRKGKKSINADSIDRVICEDKDGSELTIINNLEDAKVDFVTDYEKKVIYSRIREIVEELDGRSKQIIMLHFGFIDDKVYTESEIAVKMNISRSYVNRLIGKTLEILRKRFQEEEIIEIKKDYKVFSKKRARKLVSIYSYFSQYTKEQVDEALLNLKEEELKIIELRYGKDLENPVKSLEWKESYNSRLYGTIFLKMKKFMDANIDVCNKQLDKREADSIVQIEDDVQDKESQEEVVGEVRREVLNEDKMSKTDWKKVLEIVRTENFQRLLGELSVKEAIVMILRLGFIEDKCYSTESIAEFLEIEVQEVREITKRVLYLYQRNINEIFDKLIENLDDSVKVLEKKSNKIDW